MYNEFDGEYFPTSEDCYKRNYVYRGFNLNLDLIDMCAPFLYPVMRDFNLKSANIVLLVYEVGNINSVQELLSISKLYNENVRRDLAFVLVGTKFDTYPRKTTVDEYEQTDELYNILPTVNAGHVLTSAKTNVGITEVFEAGLHWHITNTHSASLTESRITLPVEKDKKKKCAIL